MTLDAATAPAGRRASSALHAALVAVAHALVAAAAVTGCLTLIRSPFGDANLPTQLVQASGIVALVWVFAVGMPGGSLLVAFVPGISGPQSLGYTLGVLALYLALVLGPTYYLRDLIGRRTWLLAHQLAALSYA